MVCDVLDGDGRTDEGFAEVKRALQLDPLSLIINITFAWVSYVMRQYEESLEQCERTIELATSRRLDI
jgi:hypothetical protein